MRNRVRSFHGRIVRTCVADFHRDAGPVSMTAKPIHIYLDFARSVWKRDAAGLPECNSGALVRMRSAPGRSSVRLPGPEGVAHACAESVSIGGILPGSSIGDILLCQAVQVKRRRGEWGITLVEPREVEQIFDQARQAVRLALQMVGYIALLLVGCFSSIPWYSLMLVSGVRSSCDTFARNSSLRRLRLVRFSLAVTSSLFAPPRVAPIPY